MLCQSAQVAADRVRVAGSQRPGATSKQQRPETVNRQRVDVSHRRPALGDALMGSVDQEISVSVSASTPLPNDGGPEG